MRKPFLLLLTLCCTQYLFAQQFTTKSNGKIRLTDAGAAFFASLPLKCLNKEYPYKTGIVFGNETQVTAPKNYHPAFFGCFDWHSSVHGHWVLVKMLRHFPSIPQAVTIKQQLSEHLSKENIEKELQLFSGENASFERIYGWAWFLQLHRELVLWNDPWAKQLAANLEPLSKHFSSAWISFLSRLAYPIRVGEHTNLAFGLNLTLDYAETVKDTALQQAISKAAFRFYEKDVNAPIVYEPGGYDFLSPSLEEARLMSKLMPASAYRPWLKQFLPQLFTDPASVLKIAIVNDRTDGKLVHLDGLNLSRSWCLNAIAEKLPVQEGLPLRKLAEKHLEAALPNVASGDYAGEHWLASFATYALMP